MKTEIKYFTNNDKEVKPEQADYAVKLTFDDDGNLVKSERFIAEK